MKTQNTNAAATHTAGPWKITLCPPFCHRRISGTSYPYATVAEIPVIKEYSSEDEANARLIAAAPELLAACKQAEWVLGECSVGPDKLSDLFPVKLASLRAAISRAEGRDV